MLIKVNVQLRKGVLDPQGQAICEAMKRAGYGFVTDVRQNKVFEITVDGDGAQIRSQIDALAKDMLSNPIIETYNIEFPEASK